MRRLILVNNHGVDVTAVKTGGEEKFSINEIH